MNIETSKQDPIPEYLYTAPSIDKKVPTPNYINQPLTNKYTLMLSYIMFNSGMASIFVFFLGSVASTLASLTANLVTDYVYQANTTYIEQQISTAHTAMWFFYIFSVIFGSIFVFSWVVLYKNRASVIRINRVLFVSIVIWLLLGPILINVFNKWATINELSAGISLFFAVCFTLLPLLTIYMIIVSVFWNRKKKNIPQNKNTQNILDSTQPYDTNQNGFLNHLATKLIAIIVFCFFAILFLIVGVWTSSTVKQAEASEDIGAIAGLAMASFGAATLSVIFCILLPLALYIRKYVLKKSKP